MVQSTGERKKPWATLAAGVLMPLWAGGMSLLTAIDSLEAHPIRGVDMLRLVTAGFGFGVAFAFLMFWLVGPKFIGEKTDSKGS